MRKIFNTIIILLLAAASVSAQSNSNSPYSRFGIGISELQGSGRNFALGGAGVALTAPFDINTVNPASYAVFKYPENSSFELLYKDVKKPNGRPFVFQVGARGLRTDIFDGDLAVSKYNTNLVSFTGKFQLQNYWAMSFGLQPVSSVGYSVSETDTVTSGDYSAVFNNKYSGAGGLNSLYWGNSFYFKGLSIGVNASYIFGPLSQTSTSVMTATEYAVVTTDLRRINVSDFSFRGGFQYTNDTIFGKFGFTIGAFAENKAQLNALQTRFVQRDIIQSGRALTDTLVNDTIAEGTVGFPLQYGVGLALHSKSLIVTADYTISDWSDVSMIGVGTGTFSKSERISAGIEFTPDATSKSFFKTVNYRVGAHTGTSNFSFGGNEITEQGMSVGLGIPVSKSLTFINLAFEVGKFGNPATNLIYENYYKVHLYFNTGAIWFQKRKFN